MIDENVQDFLNSLKDHVVNEAAALDEVQAAAAVQLEKTKAVHKLRRDIKKSLRSMMKELTVDSFLNFETVAGLYEIANFEQFGSDVWSTPITKMFEASGSFLTVSANGKRSSVRWQHSPLWTIFPNNIATSVDETARILPAIFHHSQNLTKNGNYGIEIHARKNHSRFVLLRENSEWVIKTSSTWHEPKNLVVASDNIHYILDFIRTELW